MTTRESNESRLRGLLSEQTVPADMVGVSLAAVAGAIVYYVIPASPVRFLMSVALLLFIPGYVLVAILYPQNGGESKPPNSGSLVSTRSLDRITGSERAALSVGLSVALVPFFGFLLAVLPIRAFDGPIVPTVVCFVLLGAVIATVRRLRLPADEQFRLPLGAARAAVAAPFTGRMPRFERVATIALGAAVLLAVVAVGYAFAVPQQGQGEQFTDLRVMTESPNGEFTLGDYPDEVPVGESTELTVGIDNREGHQQTYTLVVTADQIIEQGESVTAFETVSIGTSELTLEDGERRYQSQTVRPGTAGAFRLNYYLYEGDPPADPSADTAYRHVHITMTAVGDGSTAPSELSETESEFAIDGSIGSGQTVENPTEPPASRRSG